MNTGLSVVTDFGNIEGRRENGVAYIPLEFAARGLGFVFDDKKLSATSGRMETYETVRWTRVEKYLRDIFSATSGENLPDQANADRHMMEETNYRPEFISESVFFLLAMKAKNEAAVRFQIWIAYEVLPQIRKYGYYKPKRPRGRPSKKKSEVKLLGSGESHASLVSQAAMLGMRYEDANKLNVEDLKSFRDQRTSLAWIADNIQNYPYTFKELDREVGGYLGLILVYVKGLENYSISIGNHGREDMLFNQQFKDSLKIFAKKARISDEAIKQGCRSFMDDEPDETYTVVVDDMILELVR
jgi:hypothetical protein